MNDDQNSILDLVGCGLLFAALVALTLIVT